MRPASYSRLMAAPDVITPYADLDELLAELLGHWQRILGPNLVGAYVQGSFALGSGDRQSDCDWLVATRGSLSEPQIAQLRKVHDEIPPAKGTGATTSRGPMRRSMSSPRSTISDGSGCSMTTAIALWSGTTTATALLPAGSCASTASRWLAPHRGRSFR